MYFLHLLNLFFPFMYFKLKLLFAQVLIPFYLYDIYHEEYVKHKRISNLS